ncbi:MAG: DUF4334 domain-containing protein [Desulfobacteraceae bacterium]|nr:DUF4334 domain-containing protein [Desulfobacteraceae bacterium]
MKARHLNLVTGLAIFCFVLSCATIGPSPSQPTEDQPVENRNVRPATECAKVQASARLLAMIQSGQAYTTAEIMPLYDQLDPVNIDFMLGTWKGGKFDAGQSPDPINWYGKRFNSANNAEPLLARKPDGTIYSFDKWGMAQLREVKFRDKVSASLIYDNKPIMDYFRKIDDNTLLGLGEMKGNITFFFYLIREKTVAKQ